MPAVQTPIPATIVEFLYTSSLDLGATRCKIDRNRVGILPARAFEDLVSLVSFAMPMGREETYRAGFKAGLLSWFAAVQLLASAVPSFAATTSLDAIDRGSWSSTGTHNPANLNYLVGECRSGCGSSPSFTRNFFVFDLTSITETITGATLRLQNPPDDPSIANFIEGGFIGSRANGEIFELHNVSSSVSVVRNGATSGNPSLAVYDDLGDGTSYGSSLVTFAANDGQFPGPGLFVDVPLNADAIAALNASRGTLFAIGGMNATINMDTTNNEYIFAFTTPTHVTKLDLTLTTPVPEPQIYATLIAGLAIVGLIARRKDRTKTL